MVAGWVLGSFAIGFAVTWLLRIYAVRANLMDIPNQRSSHSVATPRGGGLSIVIAVVVFFVFSAVFDAHGSPADAVLVVAAVFVAIIGFIDDHRHVPAKIRFACHAVAAIAIVIAAGGLAPLPIGSSNVDLGVVGDVMAVVFVVWFTNLFNFMDGIDGIAGAESVTIAGGMLIILGLATGEIETLLAVIVASTFGFLVWNWPPAKIFMGDVGSGFIGFLLAAIAVEFHAERVATPWPWLILAGVFIVDATITLLVRIARGEVWHSAHRSHAYQVLSRKAGNHVVVTSGVAAVNVLWLMPLAWAAHGMPESGWWLAIVAWLPIAVCAVLVGAGRTN